VVTTEKPPDTGADAYAGRTPWSRRLRTPLSRFIRAEAGGARARVEVATTAPPPRATSALRRRRQT